MRGEGEGRTELLGERVAGLVVPMAEGDMDTRGVREPVCDEDRHRVVVTDTVRVVIWVVGIPDLLPVWEAERQREMVMDTVRLAKRVVAAGEWDPDTEKVATLDVALGVEEEDTAGDRDLCTLLEMLKVAALVEAMGVLDRLPIMLRVAGWVEAIGLRVKEGNLLIVAGWVEAMGLRVSDAIIVTEATRVEGMPVRERETAPVRLLVAEAMVDGEAPRVVAKGVGVKDGRGLREASRVVAPGVREIVTETLLVRVPEEHREPDTVVERVRDFVTVGVGVEGKHATALGMYV